MSPAPDRKETDGRGLDRQAAVPDSPPTVALVVLTLDEERHLSRCLASAEGLAGEIFVVDSGSTDRTAEIAARHGATVVVRPFTTQADQFNWALDHLPIRSDWVLKLDADEYLLPALAREIRDALGEATPEVGGFHMKRRIHFRGRWMRHGGVYPTWFLRIFRRGAARSEEREMDEHVVLLRGASGRLRHDFVDDNRRNLRSWLAKHGRYAAREARALLRESEGATGAAKASAPRLEARRRSADPAARRRWWKERVYGRMPLFVRPVLYFLYRYVVRSGWRDGARGLVFHALQGLWYRFLVDVRFVQLRRRSRGSRPGRDSRLRFSEDA